eukprot:TRINITY_DN110148_c0_g1_i1.p1 TRINITY_DN110148_c0_g1~~TRINITY_DN110148_c0_g1_i1.p1  ORF type:complete len:338 (+),score=31.90 TRINITY_DN110148_c0_g1_i1:138-1151(+)
MLSRKDATGRIASLTVESTQRKKCRLRERTHQEWQHAQLAQLSGSGLLHCVFAFLRLSEMPALWSATRGLRDSQRDDDEQLWRTLFSRRFRVGALVNHRPWRIQPETLALPGELLWRRRYENALRHEAIGVPIYVHRLQERVPGVLGLLAQYVCVKDDKDRAAALCGLRRSPLLARDFAAASACIVQIRQLRAETTGETDECSDILFPGRLVVVTLDCDSQNPALDRQLARLRAMDGTCRPLLDCYDFQVDTRLDQEQLRAALRAEVGATAVCEGAEEAERIATEERCSVICCQGKRLAEYCHNVLPAVQWTDFTWDANDSLWNCNLFENRDCSGLS